MPGQPPSNPFRCTHHPAAAAAWRCMGCERQLCEPCAAPGERSHTEALAFCVHCGGGTLPLTVAGVAQPFRALLGLTFVLPVGLRTAGVLFGVVMSSGLLGRAAHHGGLAWGLLLAPTALTLAVLTALLLQASAQGLGRLGPEEEDVHPPVVGPALRLLPLTAALLALPQLSAYAPVWRSGPAWSDLLLLVVGGLLGPVLSLGLVLGRPVHTARRLLSLGADLWLAALLTGLTVLLAWHFLAAAAFIEREDPVLGLFTTAVHAAALLGLLWLARLHGTLLHTHAPAFGYPLSPRHQVPVAPGARPRGTPWRPAAPPPKVVVPLQLEAAPEPPALAALLRALEARDATGALGAFGRLEAPQRALLSPETCVQLGRAAGSRGEWAVAREALTLGTRVRPEHPASAVACVLLARLLAERLGEPDAADALYRHVVAGYPHTEAAGYARARLGGTAA